MSIANCATCAYLGLQRIEPEMAVTVCRRNAPGAKGWPAIQAPDTDGCGQHNFATDYTAWLENRVIEARALAKTCYDHSVFPADSSEVALDAQAKFEKWGMR